MQVELNKPEIQDFINQQVREGHFTSPTDLIESAVVRMMDENASEDFDDETLAAIARAEEQIKLGQVRSFEQAAAELKQKHLGI